jgi:hypothetical protein
VRLNLAIFFALLFSLTNCSGGSSVSGGSSNLNLTEDEVRAVTGADGIAAFSFSISPGVSAFQLEASSPVGELRLLQVAGPSGAEIIGLESNPKFSEALQFQNSPNTFRAPLLTGSVVPGNYTAVYEVRSGRNRQAAGVEIIGKILTKRDADLNNGTLRLNVVLVGPVADAADTHEALDGILEIVKVIYERAGIALDINLYDFAGAAKVPNPHDGDFFYETLSDSVRHGAVNVVLAADVNGTRGNDTRYGAFGASPGAATPSARSAVAISILEVTGRDGKFDFKGRGRTQEHNDEPRLAAEEIARHIGHYLGLTNIVDFGTSGISRVSGSDLLNDTPSCLSYTDCQTEDLVRSNIMFPIPLPKIARDQGQVNNGREYYRRDAITNEQRAVMNRSVLVD